METTKLCACAVTITGLLHGCVQVPQNAEELRKAVPGAMLMKIETYDDTRSSRMLIPSRQTRLESNSMAHRQAGTRSTGRFEGG